jgi:hypothetical protein
VSARRDGRVATTSVAASENRNVRSLSAVASQVPSGAIEMALILVLTFGVVGVALSLLAPAPAWLRRPCAHQDEHRRGTDFPHGGGSHRLGGQLAVRLFARAAERFAAGSPVVWVRRTVS